MENRPNKLVTRLVYGTFIGVTAAFVIATVVQVAQKLFGGDDRPMVSAACGAAVRSLASAVDRGLGAAATASNGDEAAQRYASARKPEWPEENEAPADAERSCAGDPAGTDALAALVRLDRAAASAVRRSSSELAPVRREVDSFIR